MEKFLSIPVSGGGHKLISATDVYVVEDNIVESCIYVMYKGFDSIVKIYYIIEGDVAIAEEGKTSLMAEAVENAIVHALQYSQGQVITTIHELPLPVDYVTSVYTESLNQIATPKE